MTTHLPLALVVPLVGCVMALPVSLPASPTPTAPSAMPKATTASAPAQSGTGEAAAAAGSGTSAKHYIARQGDRQDAGDP